MFLDTTVKINSGAELDYPIHGHLLQVIRDIFLHKIKTMHNNKKKSFILIQHVNKIVAKVNVNHILNDSAISSLFPVKSEIHAKPSVSYAYSESVISSIVNYTKLY